MHPPLKPLILSVVMVLAGFLVGCNPPKSRLTDLESFEKHDKRDGLIHGNTAIMPPSDKDNAKITIKGDTVTLATAHVMSIKSERYQPTFRLEGVIIPAKQTAINLPKDGKLSQISVKSGQAVKVGDKLGDFYQEIIIAPLADDGENNDDNKDSEDGKGGTDKDIIDKNNSLKEKSTQNTPLKDNNKHETAEKRATKPKDSTKHTTNKSSTTQAPDKDISQEPDNTDDEPPTIIQEPFELHATLDGKVGAILATNRQKTYPKGSPILVVFDDRFIKFISPLPDEFAKFLAVGDAVKFDTEDGRTFNGQIERISPNPAASGMMEIHVAIKPEQASKAMLKLGERVGGYVNYGQIDVGVLVPDFAILDDDLSIMDLSDLSKPPYKPATPRHAWLWTVGQNERLTLSPILVVEYYPQSDQYLVAGIPLDGLIVLASLPKNADGKRVRLK